MVIQTRLLNTFRSLPFRPESWALASGSSCSKFLSLHKVQVQIQNGVLKFEMRICELVPFWIK